MLIAILIISIFITLCLIYGFQRVNERLAETQVTLDEIKEKTDKLGTYGYESTDRQNEEQHSLDETEEQRALDKLDELIRKHPKLLGKHPEIKTETFVNALNRGVMKDNNLEKDKEVKKDKIEHRAKYKDRVAAEKFADELVAGMVKGLNRNVRLEHEKELEKKE